MSYTHVAIAGNNFSHSTILKSNRNIFTVIYNDKFATLKVINSGDSSWNDTTENSLRTVNFFAVDFNPRKDIKYYIIPRVDIKNFKFDFPETKDKVIYFKTQSSSLVYEETMIAIKVRNDELPEPNIGLVQPKEKVAAELLTDIVNNKI